MKKVYEKAEVKVYEMEIESAILEGSPIGIGDTPLNDETKNDLDTDLG